MPPAEQTNPAGAPLDTTNTPVSQTFGTISHPKELDNLFNGSANQGISAVFSGLVEIIFVIAAIIFIFFFLWSALEFIYSRGDKEHLQSAKNRLTWAIIGLILLSVSFMIIKVIGSITGFTFFV